MVRRCESRCSFARRPGTGARPILAAAYRRPDGRTGCGCAGPTCPNQVLRILRLATIPLRRKRPRRGSASRFRLDSPGSCSLFRRQPRSIVARQRLVDVAQDVALGRWAGIPGDRTAHRSPDKCRTRYDRKASSTKPANEPSSELSTACFTAAHVGPSVSVKLTSSSSSDRIVTASAVSSVRDCGRRQSAARIASNAGASCVDE